MSSITEIDLAFMPHWRDEIDIHGILGSPPLDRNTETMTPLATSAKHAPFICGGDDSTSADIVGIKIETDDTHGNKAFMESDKVPQLYRPYLGGINRQVFVLEYAKAMQQWALPAIRDSVMPSLVMMANIQGVVRLP